jgi:hypothetical protein
MDPRVFAALVESLRRVSRIEARRQHASRAAPSAGSAAAHDLDHPLGRHGLETLQTCFTVAWDHLEVWRRLLTTHGIQPAFSHLSLVRGALEAAVLSRWLLDRRVSRMVAPPPYPPARQRHEALHAARRVNGVAVTTVPPTSDLLRDYARTPGGLPGRGLYRVISAAAHARQRVLLVSEQSPLEEEVRTETGASLRRVSSSDTMSLVVTRAAVDTFVEAVADLEWYIGITSTGRQ